MENRLDLDTSVLKEKPEVQTSLTDLNNLKLFTDTFAEKIDRKKENDFFEQQQLQANCFSGEIENVTEKEIIGHLFSSSQMVRTQELERSVDYGNYYMLLGSIIAGFVICSIVFGFRAKKGTEKYDDNIND